MTEKGFDCVRLMRVLRDEIDRDVESMTPEQRIAYIRRRADRTGADLALPKPAAPKSHHVQTY